MMKHPIRQVTSETVLQDMARLLQSYRMYPESNTYVQTAAERAVKSLAEYDAVIRVTKVGDEFVLEDKVMTGMLPFVKKFFESCLEAGWESVRLEPGMEVADLLRVMERLSSGIRGPFQTHKFTAGAVDLDGGKGNRLAEEAAGYLVLVPIIQELMTDLVSGKRGAWVRGHEVVRLMTEHMISGEDLFGPVKQLKDFDEYTFTHALNVSMLALSIASTMEVAEKIRGDIAMGALCHDLGKQAVKREVLHKPGSFTPEEKAMMDRHPLEGAAIILSSADPHPPLVPVIAFEHHVRADLTGYPKLPDQLRPHPASLLVSVADTYDALRTVRSYQQPFTQPGALSILIREANQGRLHGLFVSVMARMLDIVTPGRVLKLEDGQEATVLSPGENDALKPLVETEEREIMDLSIPGSPRVETILDKKA